MSHSTLASGCSILVLCALLTGCAAKEFRAFDGPVNPDTDVKLLFKDRRIRIVNVDGLAVPASVSEDDSRDRTVWVRPKNGQTRMTLGIARHDAVVDSVLRSTPMPMTPPPPGVSVSAGFGQQSGHFSTVVYPGSRQNQKVALATAPKCKYVIELEGKVDEAKKPVWGFTAVEVVSNSRVTVKPLAWEPNASGGVDATPWNLWDMPDDAFQMRATTYR
jgi:hypothetical protein